MGNFEMKCLQEVAKLRKENNAMKQIICAFLEDEGRDGSTYYYGIGLHSIKDIEDKVSDIQKRLPNCGTKYVVNGVDDISGTTFNDFECFGTTLIDIAGLYRDAHEREDNDFWYGMRIDSKYAIEYLEKHGFKVSVVF